MPTITETPVTLWAFCPDGACPGYETVEVDGISREVSRTAFEEAGPGTVNGNSISTSFMQYLVPTGETDELGHAIAAELPCPHCDRMLQVSSSPRPVYANTSNQDPMTLLNRRKDAERNSQRDVELADLKASNAALQAQLGQVLAGLAAGQARPARKAKPDDAPEAA